jgi:hypothetical protein
LGISRWQSLTATLRDKQAGGSSVIGFSTLTQALTLTGSPLIPKYHFVAPVVQ